jgi:hypothetical protein
LKRSDMMAYNYTKIRGLVPISRFCRAFLHMHDFVRRCSGCR